MTTRNINILKVSKGKGTSKMRTHLLLKLYPSCVGICLLQNLAYAVHAALSAEMFDVSLQSCAFGWPRVHPTLSWCESLQPEWNLQLCRFVQELILNMAASSLFHRSPCSIATTALAIYPRQLKRLWNYHKASGFSLRITYAYVLGWRFTEKGLSVLRLPAEM